MAKSNPKPKKERGDGREVTSPIDGKVRKVPGTKAGKKKVILPYGHPERTHDGPKFRSNQQRFDSGGRKRQGENALSPDAQNKLTGTKENPYT